METGNKSVTIDTEVGSEFFFEDQSFDSDKCSHSYHLSVEIGEGGFAFSVLDLSEKKYVLWSRKLFKEVQEIESCISEYAVLKNDFRSSSLAFVNPKSCLVPNQYFDSSKVTELFDFNQGEHSGELLFDDLIDLDAKLIYEVDNGLLNFIKRRFSGAKLLATTSVLTEQLVVLNKSSENVLVLADVQSETFNLLIAKDGGLLLQNTFAYSSPEDITYYTMFCLDQLEIKNTNTELFLSGKVSASSELHKLLAKYIQTVTFTQNLTGIKISQEFKQAFHRGSTLFNQYLCA